RGPGPVADRKSRDCECSDSTRISRRRDRPDEPDSVGGRLVDAGRSVHRDAPLDASDGESSDYDVDDARTCLLRHTGSEEICVDSESHWLSPPTDAESR